MCLHDFPFIVWEILHYPFHYSLWISSAFSLNPQNLLGDAHMCISVGLSSGTQPLGPHPWRKLTFYQRSSVVYSSSPRDGTLWSPPQSWLGVFLAWSCAGVVHAVSSVCEFPLTSRQFCFTVLIYYFKFFIFLPTLSQWPLSLGVRVCDTSFWAEHFVVSYSSHWLVVVFLLIITLTV